MWDMNDVTRIKYVDGYIYHITFDDGSYGDVDFSEYLSKGPVFEPQRVQNGCASRSKTTFRLSRDTGILALLSTIKHPPSPLASALL